MGDEGFHTRPQNSVVPSFSCYERNDLHSVATRVEGIVMGIDLEKPSGEHHREDSEPQGNVNVGDPESEAPKRDGATTSRSNNHDKEITGPKASGCTPNRKHKMHATDVVVNSQTAIEPHDGIEFESKEDAFSYYKEYAKSVGFATIIKASRRSRITGKFIDAKFVCTRYGSKRESSTTEISEPVPIVDGTESIPIKRKRGRINRSWSKTDCKACMHVKRRQDGRWVIRTFIKEHNHEIFPDQAYYFRGHRNIDLDNSNVDAFNAIRARNKKMYVTMSRQSGGVKKVTHHKSGSTSSGRQHLALEEGDVQAMLDHFMLMQDENPNFFYSLDFNEEQCLRNVFWIDAKGRLDYGNFKDVVFFDTTYIKNEYKLPFAPFIGVNHHCQFLLLGCALIADETKSTYAWIMRAWLRAMGQQAPKVILTDQDKALKEAIAEVFPDAHHCFCLWHILSKIPEKLGYVLRQHENFITKFNKCIFKSSTDDMFEKRWRKMVDGFNLRNDIWIQSLYEDRALWAPTYMKDIFLAGMSTMQRSESISSLFDKYMQRKTTLKEFLDQCKTILQDKCEEEAKADFETWHKQPGLKSPSPFGKQMATVYTHAIFKKFQVEVLGVVACHPKKESDDDATATFKVHDFEHDQEFIVVWNESASDISCSCHLFEYNGFLCRHVMIVLQMSGVHNIPCQYILKRWTKDAKNRQARTHGPDLIESRIQRYNDICQRAFKLGDEGSLSLESYNIAFHALEEALTKCESVNNSIQSIVEAGSPSALALHDFEEGTQGNIPSKTNKKNVSKKRQVQLEMEVMTMGMHDSWQQMGHSNFQAPTPGCSYETQESIQGMEQLNSRVPALDGYFGAQQIIQGVGQLNGMVPNRDDYYSNQQSIQGLGQLNSIAPVHDGHYLTHQRLHGLGPLHFRPQSIQSCFDIQDTLQDMDQSNVGPTQLHGMASKHLQSKHLPR